MNARNRYVNFIKLIICVFYSKDAYLNNESIWDNFRLAKIKLSAYLMQNPNKNCQIAVVFFKILSFSLASISCRSRFKLSFLKKIVKACHVTFSSFFFHFLRRQRILKALQGCFTFAPCNSKQDRIYCMTGSMYHSARHVVSLSEQSCKKYKI